MRTPSVVASQAMAILAFFMQSKDNQVVHTIQVKVVDQSFPQDFFDAMDQGNP